MKLNKNDGKWLLGIGIFWVMGLWALWKTDLSGDSLILHIKFVYSLFLTLALVISAYYIIFKLEEKKNGKK